MTVNFISHPKYFLFAENVCFQYLRVTFRIHRNNFNRENCGVSNVNFRKMLRENLKKGNVLEETGNLQLIGNIAIIQCKVSEMKRLGCRNIKLMVLVAAPEGIKAVTESHPDVDIYAGAVDSHLNERGYIVPGLGDAGDRIFGTK